MASRNTLKKSLSLPFSASYTPKEVEAEWNAIWEKKHYFTPSDIKAEGAHDSQKFVMVIPPPNVTGSLHLGHTLTVAIQDTLSRWHRMQGHITLWVPGVDHAGIATQSVVERFLLKKEGKTRHDYARDAFMTKVWEWKEQYGDHIKKQLRMLGTSVDWTREVFTMDPKLSLAVTEAFVRLHDQKLIYRAKRLVSWCSFLQTALSDIEVITEEIEKPQHIRIPGFEKTVEVGCLWHFYYKIKNSEEKIGVATTRIETMLGDTAVAVHPHDSRYKAFIGQELVHPFFPERSMKIISDEAVDQNFGTGAVKITPAHDRNDYEMGLRHQLEMINIFTTDGKINENGGPYSGLHRFECRRRIEQDLKALGLLGDKTANPKKMQLPRCSRSNDIIEYMLIPQWWVDCQAMAARAIDAVRTQALKIIPSNFEQTWYYWLENIRDWCVSRQLWWGHRIPVYKIQLVVPPSSSSSSSSSSPPPSLSVDFDPWVVGRTPEEALERAVTRLGGISPSFIHLEQDEDVLDTWFSSALFPFSVMGWPKETFDMAHYFPNSLLETGHDILFFWVARMVMMSLQLTNRLPFTTVFLHSLIRDAHGQKMSKSKGNVIDPLDIIHGISLENLHQKLLEGNLPEKEVNRAKELQRKDYPKGIPECGADALRFGLLAYTKQGRNINLDINRVVGYRHFCNKLWNAVRFALLSFPPDFEASGISFVNIASCSFIHRWILHCLSSCAREVNAALMDYRFGDAIHRLYSFWLYEFCDIYLEAIKPILHTQTSPSSPSSDFPSSSEIPTHAKPPLKEEPPVTSPSSTSRTPLFVSTQNLPLEQKITLEVLYTCMDWGLRLLHPTMPFVTEELYQRLPPSKTKIESICIAPYPQHILRWNDPFLEENMHLLMLIVRQYRSLMRNLDIHPKHRLSGFIRCKLEADGVFLKERAKDIAVLAKLLKVELLAATEADVPGCVADAVNEKVDIFLECGEIVDFQQAYQTLTKRIFQAQKAYDGYEKKVQDPNYATRVPEEVRQTNKDRMQQLIEEIQSLNISLKNVGKFIKTEI